MKLALRNCTSLNGFYMEMDGYTIFLSYLNLQEFLDFFETIDAEDIIEYNKHRFGKNEISSS